MAGEIPVYCAFDEIVALADLTPNPRNPNRHPDEQIKLLAKIIEKQGWRQPVKVSTRSGLIVSGHGRYQAAQLLRCPVPVDFQDYATDEEELADLTADNRIAELAENDEEMLAEILAEIDLSELPTELTGYTDDDLYNTLLLPAFNNYRKHTIPKAAFYIWHAGSTRRDFEDAMTQAGLAERQYIIWAKNGISIGRSDYQHAHEPCFYAAKDGETPNYYGDRAQHTIWRVTTKQDGLQMTVLGGGVVLTDGKGGQLCITDKPPKGKKMRYIRMEEGQPVDLYRDDRMQTLWEVARETGYLHPTQKPVEIPVRAIENSSQPGDIVLDFFGGSGSTLMGAELTGRRCYTTELDPVYCDVIVSRYVGQTGNMNVICIRNGKEMPYMDLVREWAKATGEEERINSMKIPVVVTKEIVKASLEPQDEA